MSEDADRHRNQQTLVVALMLLFVFLLPYRFSALYLVPTLAAAYWLGRRGGGYAGALGGTLGIAGVVLAHHDSAEDLAGAGVRLAVFTIAGYVVGRAFESSRRLRSKVDEQAVELEELRAIQRALTPTELPQRPGLELAVSYAPADHGVSGDFYIVAAGPRDSTVVVIGDVVGKGIDAARRATFVRTALASFAKFVDDPCRLLQMANFAVTERAGASSDFITAACVVVRLDGTVSWALAGHQPPIWLDAGTPLNGVRPAFPLGLGTDLECASGSAEAAPGAGVVLFTDGLTEAHRPGQELFGEEGVRRVVADMRGSSPREVVDRLPDAAREFAGVETLRDDLCVVALRRTASPCAAAVASA